MSMHTQTTWHHTTWGLQILLIGVHDRLEGIEMYLVFLNNDIIRILDLILVEILITLNRDPKHIQALQEELWNAPLQKAKVNILSIHENMSRPYHFLYENHRRLLPLGQSRQTPLLQIH